MIIQGVLEEADPDTKHDSFIRLARNNYMPDIEDPYMSSYQIEKFGLQTGDLIECEILPPKRNKDKKSEYYRVVKILLVNGNEVNVSNDKVPFSKQKPVNPYEHLVLEHDPNELSTRIIDLIAPIGKGQRSLIIAPAYSGKTTTLKNIAAGIEYNYPDIELTFLLIDERPEEVTDVEESINGQVISSTFDMQPQQHIRIAELVIEKAKRQAENGKDIVILLDSITRLVRAYNIMAPKSGKMLSGGISASAFFKPRQFLGSARKLRNSGSITIISTVLVETESRGDQVIYEELKGTGNSELHLDRDLLDSRIYPTIDINQSKTRREELLFDEVTLNVSWALREALNKMKPAEALLSVRERIKQVQTNDQLITTMRK